MNKVQFLRNKLNYTQQELAEKTGLSLRTIQRIESGQKPQGHTLKVLLKALEIEDLDELNSDSKIVIDEYDYNNLKLINLIAIVGIVLPPINIILPIILKKKYKENHNMSKQIITLQIIWTIMSFIIFMLCSFIKNWFNLSSKFILIVMITLVLSNVIIILTNNYFIDQKQKLFFKLNFNVL
ncbi:helix-turn-helix transcriptional regulator [Flavobacterium piscinae]|uniref:XRE family transcriptional regulator n=1 Tax=Flavobacterium piscinae TaxID=2506424 RepID=A0A4Q1KX41_9FLAO|nr:helix-turn-helix transcriptional regulator [Flavobacterium piscinae]MBC8884084.1 helix-turn-helix transcriptional regulator [Flavobacterium piscinae]RXR34812.1 XRE family transcriptional regulator [Flavobacterium piscinae]